MSDFSGALAGACKNASRAEMTPISLSLAPCPISAALTVLWKSGAVSARSDSKANASGVFLTLSNSIKTSESSNTPLIRSKVG
jgi:hypothetical protein